MSSASMPPMKKKNMAAPPYMMPMRLWSTVVSQLFQPDVLWGRVKLPSGRDTVVCPVVSSRGAVGRSTIAIGGSWLLQRLEERDQLVDLVLLEVEIGHAADLLAAAGLRQRRGVHRLLGRRVAEPRLEGTAVEGAADLARL